MPPADGSLAGAEAALPAAGRAERPRILAYAADEATEAALRGGLADIAPDLILRRGDAALAARQLAKEPTPGVLVVDIAAAEDGLAALEALAAVCMPDVRVLVVGDRADIPFYRALTQDLGVLEYLYKPLTRDRVSRLFGPHVAGLAQAPAAERGGTVTAVCGVRGGAGASTVAVNLSLMLGTATRGHIALLDLHLRGGTAALMLGASPGSGLRAGLENPDRVDALFLDRVSLPVEERVRLVAAEEPMEAEFSASPAAVARVLEVLRARFNHVVVDLPSPPGPAERVVLAQARHRILVLPPDVAGIRDAEAMRRLCTALGSGRTYLVLNRAGASGWLPAEVVREGVGGSLDALIPDMPDRLPRAANLGQPAVRDCAPLRRALSPLVQEVGGRPAEEGQGAIGALLRRVLRR
jgi:pilus assembly protein CpaE